MIDHFPRSAHTPRNCWPWRKRAKSRPFSHDSIS